MALTLKEFALEIEAIYQPLLGKTFEGSIDEKNTTAVCTGGPRDVVNVDNDDVCELMKTIVENITKVSSKFEPDNTNEKVWKGITMNPPRLWVESYKGDEETKFKVTNIEVLTDLNWQKPYKAMVNITLA